MQQTMQQLNRMEFMAATLSSIGDGMIVTDNRGNVLYLNESAQKLTGWSEQEAVGRPFREVFVLVNFFTGKPLDCPVLSALEHEKSIGLRNHSALLTRGGETRYVSASCSPIRKDDAHVAGVVTVFRDIDRIKCREEETRRENEDLKNVLETLPLGILLVEENAVVKWVNRPLLNLFRSQEADMIGRCFGDGAHCIHSYEKGCGNSERCQLCEIRQSIEQAVRKGISRRDVILRRAFLNDDEANNFWLKINFIPLATPDEKQVVVAIEDITEQKNYEATLQQGRHEAESASRAKSEFLATMSHEIRTPLNGIIGMLDLLMMSDTSQEQQEYTHMAMLSAKSLLKVINDILDFSRLEAGKISFTNVAFDIKSLAEEVIKIHTVLAEKKGLGMILSFDPEIPRYLTGDPDRVRQILNNLIGNAVKFTDHGQVKLAVRRQEEPGPVVWLEFLVSDTGIGISADKMDLLFQRFSQVDGSNTRKYSGTGLGLAICKQLAQLMGGNIQAQSEFGKGSTFRFSVGFGSGMEPALDAIYGPIMDAEPPMSLVMMDNGDLDRLITEKTLDGPDRAASAQNLADPAQHGWVRLGADGELVYDNATELADRGNIPLELDKLELALLNLQSAIEENRHPRIEEAAHMVKKIALRIHADDLVDLAFRTELAARKSQWRQAMQYGLSAMDKFKSSWQWRSME